MGRKLLAVAALGTLAWASLPAGSPAAPTSAENVLAKTHLDKGICVVLSDRQCALAIDLAGKSKLTIFAQLAGSADARAACRAADEAGLYGRRIFVAKGDLSRIHLASNTADAVVSAGDADGLAEAEVLRVLHPGGMALLGGKELTKPLPAGTDDWTHHYHGPDNNTQSQDRLARAPYLTHYVREPRYAPCPQAAVAAGGRLFMAFGHVAWHEREEPWMNTLIATNAYNGTILWRRPLTRGIMVDRSTIIATPTRLYVGDKTSCHVLDAATGKQIREIAPPADTADGGFWKWMALSDGVLYALVGKADQRDPDARWRRRVHGWPWGGISKGYNQADYRWGFARTLLAMEAETGKVLWRHREDAPMDSRALCMAGGRIYLCSFGRYLACVDAKTGKDVWRVASAAAGELFKKIGPFSGGHGYRSGWKSTAYLRCTEEALYFTGPQLRNLTAVSAADGKCLWTRPAKINVHVMVRDDGLYTIGAQGIKGDSHKLDPLTGKVLASYEIHRRACTRLTGTADGILFRASGGSCRLDLATGKPQWISPMRPPCQLGVIVAHGHLYWLPWVCDCSLQMFGTICCEPAGDFPFAAPADAAERLEAGEGGPAKVANFRVNRGDWPTYLGNNARAAQTGWRAMSVPEDVELAWTFQPKAPYEPTAPVFAGGTVFLGGSDGIVRALGAASGKLRWKAYTGGAVRYPPSLAGPRALVGSGDGWAYAFEAATGRLLWRFRAAPVERRIPVYGQLQSTWPVASGVLVEKGLAYFAAGMNDYDGTHVYAVDAATGKIKWHNSTSGQLDEFSRRGVAVQGHLLSSGGKLYLAGGNAVSPGVYDMASGKCLNNPPDQWGTRAPRGRELVLDHGHVAVSGQPLYSLGRSPVFDGSVRWRMPILVGRNANLIFLPGRDKKGPPCELVAWDTFADSAMWARPLPAKPVRWGMAAAGGRIVVTLTDGRVVCFAAKPKLPA